MTPPTPSTPTSERAAPSLLSPASVNTSTTTNIAIPSGAASSRFASSPSSNSMQASYSATSSTASRPSSPVKRLSSPSVNRRAPPLHGSSSSPSSSSAGIQPGGVNHTANSNSASSSAHNPLHHRHNSSTPSTPQRHHTSSSTSRPGSRSGALTPSHPSYNSLLSSAAAAAAGSSSSSSPSALTSLQELIRTMPSAGSGPASGEGNNSPSARSSPINTTANARLRSTSSSSGNPAAAASSAQAPTTTTTTTSTTSTLNPNAGGFQPGALSALGEVENEVLITPQVATFAAAGAGVGGMTSPHRQHAQGGGPQSPPPRGAGIQHAGGPFTSNANTNTNTNVFGSPIQTPQSQVGTQHNPYAINMNTPEWQNFHNVFNKGIGVNNGAVLPGAAGTPPSQSGASNAGSAQSPVNGGNPVDFASLLAGMNNNNAAAGGPISGGGIMDFNNNNANAQQQAIAAALGMNLNLFNNNNNNSNNPMQAQLAMLQQLQLQAQQQAQFQQQQNAGFSTPQQQAALALQTQQMQLQALMSAQNALQAQTQSQVAPGSLGGAGGMTGNRFNTTSNSQPDLASLAALSAGGVDVGNIAAQQQGGASNQFMMEQMALQAQYEQLRLQQQDLMNRFQEMQLHAAQLAQAQAQMSPGGHHQQQHALPHSPVHHHQQQQQQQISSPLGGGGQQQQQHAREASIQQGQSAGVAGTTTAGGRPHRRGPSQSISGGLGGIASSGPMGQFGSMGQFALPSSNNNMSGTVGGGGGVPKGHGRRHSVNVANKRNENNINMAFSFPAGSGNPTQQSNNTAQQQQQNVGDSQHQEDGNEGAAGLAQGQNRAARAFGHGRRESRGSIGSLAGWGSNSNVVTQSSVPITQPTVTDLAQAQNQLLQLSQFRASAGHSRIPSFGMQQLQGGPGGNNQQQRKSLFAPYLPAASIPPLLQTGKLVIGILRVNKRNRSDAYVATDVLDADVFICGSKDRNRALEGDVVAVELLDVDEVWGTKKEKEEKKRKKEESTSFDPKFQQQLRKQDKKRDDVEVEGQGLTLFDDEEVNDDSKPTYAGHVIAVVERQAGQLFAGTLGILRPSSAATKEKQDAERRERDGIDIRGDEQRNRPKIVWFKPVDKRVPLVAIPADQAPSGFLDRPDDYVNTLFVACIKRWPITSLHPFGSLVEELGEIGDLEAESNALLKDCGFTDETFTDNVAKCLPPTPWNIPQTEIDARKDFRQCRVFTIDPDTARDLDDALHINKLDDGTFEVGVHIADVSHFVKPNTALDREARRRGTTVYLVQRASPMLPEALSSNLCSLQPGEERLAFSSVFKMTPDGRVLSSWFGKSVIKSAAKLSYNMAQQAIDEGKLPENLTIHDEHDMEGIVSDIKQLDAMAKEMRARRFENGALRIDNVKLSFALDEDGRPIDCVVYDRKDSHSLIEEFMLTANQAVAQKIASALPEQALLRRHEMPIARRLEGFVKRAGKLGFDFDITSAGALMKSFNALSKEDPELVLRLLATKAMLRASYICSGMFDIAKYHHYALNIPIYTHFTSPIRRYADVIVHRQLEAALSENPEGRFLMDPEAVSKVAQHCNIKKSAAKLAQEGSQHLYLCTMISDLTQKYGPVMRQATVIGVLDQAFDVVVSEFGIEKRVHADQMPIENHVYDGRSNTLQLYWQKGVDVIKFLAENSGDPHLQRVKETAEQHARLMESSTQSTNAESALFEDDEAEEGEVREVAPSKSKSAQQLKSIKNAAPVFEAVETTSAGHCVQTIKELQTVPVIVSSDLTVCPPVLKIFAVNPFN